MKKALSLLLALVMCLSLVACGGGNDTPTTGQNEQLDNNPPSTQETPAPNTTEAEEDWLSWVYGEDIIVDYKYFYNYAKENSIFVELTPDNWKSHFTVYESTYEEKDEWGEITTKTSFKVVPDYDSNCYWGIINPANLEKDAVFEISVDGEEITVLSFRDLMKKCQVEEGYSFEKIEVIKCSAKLVIVPLRDEWIGTADGRPAFSYGDTESWSTATGVYPSFEGGDNDDFANFLRDWLSEEN